MGVFNITNYKSGVYKTIYGNACEYYSEDGFAFDLDSREDIPEEMVDFEQFLHEL